MTPKRLWLRSFLALTLALGSPDAMTQTGSPSPRRDINAVLADNDEQLLAMPGVVGVYVGLLEDGTTSCLKIMLSRPRAAGDASLPRKIEGYPVITEVTGEIRPR
ncbi:MAG: hypothetical protein ABR589_02015 [Chthoniobacterales bacterium]